MKWVYLIRHGRPDFPSGQTLCLGRADLPLGSEGFAQAAAAAQALPPVTAVFSSPLRRAVQTARAIGEPNLLPGLTELSMGAWDGLCFSQIRRDYPQLYAARGEDPALLPPGAEPGELGLRRFLAAMEQAALQAPGDFAVVSHAGVIRLFLEHLGSPPAKPHYGQIIPLFWDQGQFFLQEAHPHA